MSSLSHQNENEVNGILKDAESNNKRDKNVIIPSDDNVEKEVPAEAAGVSSGGHQASDTMKSPTYVVGGTPRGKSRGDTLHTKILRDVMVGVVIIKDTEEQGNVIGWLYDLGAS